MLLPDSRHRLTGLLKQAGVALAYASLLYFGDAHFESESVVGYFEPACGLALAALLIGGMRYARAIFIGAIVAWTISGESLPVAATMAASDAAEAVFGVWLLTRNGNFDLRLPSLRDYLRLILLGGGVSIAASAMVANMALLLSGMLAPEDYFHGLLRWWMGDTLGIILVTPLILVWWRAEYDGRHTRRVVEAVMLLGLTVLVGQIVFLDWLRDIAGQIAQSYWMFMLIVWVAMFLGARGTTVALAVVAFQGLFGAIQGVGYFADDIARTHLVNYWFYMLTLSLVGMSLATYIHEMREAKFASAQRDTLIREIHHRIKNNLQGVTGLLRQFADSHPETAEAVNQTIGQVQSIAAIHGLQEGAPGDHVRLREMAEAVAAAVGALWQKPVAVEVPPDWAPCVIQEAEAVPLALIINELLSNAIKHGGRAGQTWVVLGQGPRADNIRLAIHNAGQLPQGFDPDGTTGAGLQLVKSLLPRAGAKLSWRHDEQENMVSTLLELESPVVIPESQT